MLMLDQYHLEQHHWVYARPAIVFAVQGLHHLVQSAKIHCSVYFPQQMLLWHQTVYANHLDYVTIHFPAFQHLSHHLLLILPLMNEKAQLMLDFFVRLPPTRKTLSEVRMSKSLASSTSCGIIKQKLFCYYYFIFIKIPMLLF